MLGLQLWTIIPSLANLLTFVYEINMEFYLLFPIYKTPSSPSSLLDQVFSLLSDNNLSLIHNPQSLSLAAPDSSHTFLSCPLWLTLSITVIYSNQNPAHSPRYCQNSSHSSQKWRRDWADRKKKKRPEVKHWLDRVHSSPRARVSFLPINLLLHMAHRKQKCSVNWMCTVDEWTVESVCSSFQ